MPARQVEAGRALFYNDPTQNWAFRVNTIRKGFISIDG